MTTVIMMLAIIAFTYFVFWQKNVFLYLLATPVLIVYGLSLAIDYTVNSPEWVIGVATAVIGTFCLFRVVVNEFLPMVKRWGK